MEESEDSIPVRIFVLEGHSNILREGSAQLVLRAGNYKKSMELAVVWIDKPRILYNSEYAIELLNLVLEEDEVERLLDIPSSSYYSKLVEFWKYYDTNLQTEYNEVMSEYYRRADFAIQNFDAEKQIEGAHTDRGKIYILYGEPDKVNRTYEERDGTVEVWEYNNLKKQFIFTDNTGMGNYTLLK